MAEPINGDDLLAQIKPVLATQRTQICLRPDLIREWENLNEQLTTTQAEGTRRLAETATKQAKALARKIQKLEADIDAASAWFVFQALPVAKYQALVAEHPPREGDQFDLYAGHNREVVQDELIRQCLIDPVFSDAGWETFKATCAPSEWAALRDAANEANGGAVAPPKSPLASLILSKSGNASESPERGV